MILPASDEAIFIGLLRLSLRMPGNRSLKDRRRVVLSLRDRVQARHHLAFAEVGHLDDAQAAVLAIAGVGNDSRVLQARLATARADVENTADALIVEASTTISPWKFS